MRSFKEISHYLHLPLCESLCAFCGYKKRLTKKHEVKPPYIENLLKQWITYLDLLGERPVIREIHLGLVRPPLPRQRILNAY